MLLDQKDIQDRRVSWGLQDFQEYQVYQERMGKQEQGVFRGQLAPKENLVLEVYLVPLVVEDHLVYEERGENQEREVTKDHKVYQDFQDLGDQLALLGCLGKKVKLAHLEDLATLERESQDSLATVAHKVTRGKPGPLDFQGHRDRQDHQGLQDFPLHLPMLDSFFQRLAHTSARNKSTRRMEAASVELAQRCPHLQLNSPGRSHLLAPPSSLTSYSTTAIRTTVPKLVFSPAAYPESITLRTTSTAKEGTCGWR